MVRSRADNVRKATATESSLSYNSDDTKKTANPSSSTSIFLSWRSLRIWVFGLLCGISLTLLPLNLLVSSSPSPAVLATANNNRARPSLQEGIGGSVTGGGGGPPPPPSIQRKEQQILNQQQRQQQSSKKIELPVIQPENKQPLGKPETKQPDTPPANKKIDPGETAMHPLEYFFDLSEANEDDKTPILKLLRDNAGLTELSTDTYEALPTWSGVTSMYGHRGRVVGKKFHCEAFLSDGVPWDKKWIAPAGHFNTGTNLLSDVIVQNCDTKKKRWQVPWGKHNPPKDQQYRNDWKHFRYAMMDSNQTLPVVLIRDPFRWHQSMCNNGYTASWTKLARPDQPGQYHCPNLWPTEFEQEELKRLGYKVYNEDNGVDPIVQKEFKGGFDHVYFDKRSIQKGTRAPLSVTPILTPKELALHHFPVKVKYCGNMLNNYTREHYSTVHMYNDWYNEYFNIMADEMPRIMTRMEDLLFFPDEVIPTICECAGTKMLHKHAKVSAETTKALGHGSPYGIKTVPTGYVSALIKYGNPKTRLKGFTPQDVQYSNHHIDSALMKTFGYKIPEPEMAMDSS